MRILITNGHMRVGGVEKSLVSFLNNIDYDKHKVDLLLFEGLGEYIDEIPKQVNIILMDLTPIYGSFMRGIKNAIKGKNIKLIIAKVALTLQSRFGIRWIKLFKLLNIVDRYYDCAISYRIGFCADFVSFVVNSKNKYVWWHHGEFDYSNSVVEQWKKTFKNMKNIICVSEGVKELISPYFIEFKDKMLVIPNMLEVDDIIKKSQLFHPYQNVSSDKTIIVSVGRMSPEKKMINTVYAMERLRKRGYKNLIWYLLGDGIERVKIDLLIEKTNLKNDVICLGNCDNPYPYIADADFLVHPSYVESQGLTILESMVLGKCGVVTKSIGAQEYVIDKKNAIVSEQSIESLVNEIIFLLEHKNILEDMQEEQWNTAQKYIPNTIMKKINTLIFSETHH